MSVFKESPGARIEYSKLPCKTQSKSREKYLSNDFSIISASLSVKRT